MYQLDVNRNRAIADHQTFYRFNFSSANQRLTPRSEHGRMVMPEIYEWLVDTVGDELTVYRTLQRAHFFQPKSLSDHVTNMEDMDRLNPPVGNRRKWTMTRDGNIAFTRTEDAALFKLRWF